MTCDEAETLIHALIDDELDAGRAREVEAHVAQCPRCAASLAAYRQMSQAVASADLRYTAPESLRRRVEAALPKATAPAPSRRAVLRCFALGSGVSAIAATGLFAIMLRNDDQERINSEIVSAHLRSLQAGHLTDVLSTDQHTVKPWFNGKVDFAPDVKDFAAQGFPLVGGRLDYLNGETVAALVYHRDKHTINAFVWPAKTPGPNTVQERRGYTVINRDANGLHYCIVSDLNGKELTEFAKLFGQ